MISQNKIISQKQEPDKSDWIRAGRIAAEIRAFARKAIKKGTSFIDAANAIEKEIYKKGAIPAFPLNLSPDTIAAHYSPAYNDKSIIEGQLLKVDIGVCYNGAIGDTAFTLDFSESYNDLLKASEKALSEAEKLLFPGSSLEEIGKAISETIESFGYKPVRNLSGHGLASFNVHAKPSVPNIAVPGSGKLEDGQIIAIEPFATDGAGLIKESGKEEIFSLIKKKPIRGIYARQILQNIARSYYKLPFAKRWLLEGHSEAVVDMALAELKKTGAIAGYAPLAEINNGFVSQAEHSYIISENTICLTKEE